MLSILGNGPLRHFIEVAIVHAEPTAATFLLHQYHRTFPWALGRLYHSLRKHLLYHVMDMGA